MAKKKKAAKATKKKKAAKESRSGSGITAVKETKTKPAKKKAAKRKAAKKPIGTCFVMMPFKEPFDMYYQSIFRPAIKAADLDPVLASDLFRPSAIVADLWQMVQDSKVLLAELTTKNANVFYELGLAHAIGKPVVLVSETMDDVPFDLQQLRVLLYDKDDPAWGDKLAKGIKTALKETLASPIEAVPGIFRKKVKSQAPEQDATIARLDALEQRMKSLSSQAVASPQLSSLFRKERMVKELRSVIGGIRGEGGHGVSFNLKSWARRHLSEGSNLNEINDALSDLDISLTPDMIR